MKLQIYKNRENKYSFAFADFDSSQKSYLLTSIKPYYDYAYQALDGANRDINILNKMSSIEDLSKPIIQDEKPEEKLINHYKNMLRETKQRLFGIEGHPEEEKKIEYMVLKSQVEDLLRVQNNIENLNDSEYHDDLKEIDTLIDGYRKIAQKYFHKFLNEEKQERELSQEDMDLPEGLNSSFPQQPEQNMDNVPLNNLTMASKHNSLTDDELLEIFNHYGHLCCKSICKMHPDAIYNSNINEGLVEILSLDNGQVILLINVNDKCHIDSIIPSSCISEIYSYNSPKFYQLYWKPIVEEIGHFFISDCNTLIIPSMSNLPDMPENSCDFIIDSWELNNHSPQKLSLSFNNDCPVWKFAKYNGIKKYFNNKYAEINFIKNNPKRVKCIDESLELFGKIGEVVQIIPMKYENSFEVDVNFGRKIVRLSEKQIQIIDDM